MVEFTDGTIPSVTFERKGLSDLISTLTKGHARFKKELARADKSGTKIILIVEGTLTKVLKGTKYSKYPGIQAVRTMMTLWLKYGLVPVFCKDRKEMATYIAEYFSAIGRLKQRG